MGAYLGTSYKEIRYNHEASTHNHDEDNGVPRPMRKISMGTDMES